MRLDDIKARVAAATPGPWYSEPAGRILPARVGVEGHRRGVGDYAFAFLDDSVRPEQGGAEWDGPFIAHARTDIPDLLRVVEAAMALLAPPLSPSGLTSDMRCRMCYGRIVVLGNQIALDHDAGCSLSINLRAALAPLPADR